MSKNGGHGRGHTRHRQSNEDRERSNEANTGVHAAEMSREAYSQRIFSCSFARHNCPHNALFSSEYQRTNRKKGTKIMRCFPHCCPRHIDRSYCGGTLHLHLQYTQVPYSVHSTHIRNNDLLVLSRFRPQDSPAIEIGSQHTQESLMNSSCWMHARLIATNDHTSWMFDLNSSNRWLYEWESGATKVQRRTLHVFETYVLCIIAHKYSVIQNNAPVYEVVATTQSPSFTLLSFRRAHSSGSVITPNTVSNIRDKFTPVVRDKRMQDRSRHIEIDQNRELQCHNHLIKCNPQIPYNPFQSKQDHCNGIPCKARFHPTQSKYDVWRRDMLRFSPFGMSDPLTSLTPVSNRVRSIAIDVATIFEFLEQVPSHMLLDVVQDHMMGLKVVLAQLESTFRRCGRHHGSVRSLITTVLQLVVWLLFDPVNIQQLNRLMERASRVLMNQSALYQVYFQSLEELDTQINMFLGSLEPTDSNKCWTLAQLAVQIRGLVERDLFMVSENRLVGFEPFVAQVREAFMSLDQQRVNRIRYINGELEYFKSSIPDLSGTWKIDASTLRFRLPSADMSINQPSALIMLWMWRLLATMHLRFGEPSYNGPTVLSLVSDCGLEHHDMGSRFVLDGKPRWLRRYPLGISTSAVMFGTQQMGDYVATLSCRDRHSDLRVNCYSWPIQTIRDQVTSAYCLRWYAVVGDTRNDRVMKVCMTVDQGALKSGQTSFQTESLRMKLLHIEQWNTLFSLRCQYTR